MDGMNEFNNNANAGSTPGSGSTESAYTQGYAATPGTGPQNPYGAPYGGPAYPPPPPPAPNSPNPGLAAVLGFIPGVGAMYNGQFAKGIAQIVIFAILTSLSDHVNPIFGLLVAGWVFYMVFDSYQTARARRDGLQVPDPFGLNNIGERFGLGHGPHWNDFVARPTAAKADPSAGPTVPPYSPAGSATGYADEAVYSAPAAGAAYEQPPAAAYAPPAYGETYAQAPYGAVPPAGVPPAGVPPYPAYGNAGYPPVPSPAFDPAVASRSSVPTGAIWLIGLGVLALLSSMGRTYYFHGKFFAGSLLVFLGVVFLIQQLTRSKGMYPERSAAATWFLVNSSRGGVFLIAIGAFMLIDAAEIARWHYIWPYLFILLGLYQLAIRAAYNRMLAETPAPPSPYAAAGADGRVVYTPPPPASTSTSIVPTPGSGIEEGR